MVSHDEKTILAEQYQIVRHLSRGGFSQTFLAKYIRLPSKPLCVVKQFKPNIHDPATLQTAKHLFDREAEILYQLGSHNQIPKLLAHFEQEQEFYLVEEFIDGQPLNAELIDGNQFSESYVTALLYDTLQVLAFVHQQNIIHCDIKPGNLIRRSRDSKIVLIDFGSVKEVGNQAANLHKDKNSTFATGSPGYMPSEQKNFNPHFSSDIYAAGMVCIQALTGVHPKQIEKNFPGQFCYALLRDRAPISPSLEAMLDRMVLYDYHQRYQNATEALQALQQLLGGSEYHPFAIVPQSQTGTLASDSTKQAANFPATRTTQLGQFPFMVKGLPNELKEQLEQLIANAVGPIAPEVLKRALKRAANYQDLVDYLTVYLPQKERSQFCQQANLLLKDQDDPTPASYPKPTLATVAGDREGNRNSERSSTAPAPQTPPPKSSRTIEPIFIKKCELELAKSIGPIAPMIIQQTLSHQPELSPIELIETLGQYIRNPEEIEAFRQSLLTLL